MSWNLRLCSSEEYCFTFETGIRLFRWEFSRRPMMHRFPKRFTSVDVRTFCPSPGITG